MKTVTLNWFGPLNFFQPNQKLCFKDPNYLSKLTGPGVYLWVYPEDVYEKIGLYIGKSVNLIKRQTTHLGFWLSGEYALVDKNTLNVREILDRSSPGFNEYLVNSWEEAFNSQIYFASTKNLKVAETVETVLILSFQKIAASQKGQSKYFCYQDLRGTKVHHDSLRIKLEGETFVKNIFGPEITWKHDNYDNPGINSIL